MKNQQESLESIGTTLGWIAIWLFVLAFSSCTRSNVVVVKQYKEPESIDVAEKKISTSYHIPFTERVVNESNR